MHPAASRSFLKLFFVTLLATAACSSADRASPAAGESASTTEVKTTCVNKKDPNDIVTATIFKDGERLEWSFGESALDKAHSTSTTYVYSSFAGADENPTVKLTSAVVNGKKGLATITFFGDGASPPQSYECTPSTEPTPPANGSGGPQDTQKNDCSQEGQRCESRSSCEGGDGVVDESQTCAGTQVCCATS
jgi:hypothetical protein